MESANEVLLFDGSAVPILHSTFPRVRAPSSDKRIEFVANHGVEILDGPFSEKEDKRIVRNYFKFIKDYNIDDGVAARCGLLGFKSDGEDKKMIDLIKQLIRPCGFYYRLANKMPQRLISAVYERARRLLHPFSKTMRDLDDETKRAIVEYAKECGPMNKLHDHIGRKFDCAPSSVREILRSKLNVKVGKWKSKEDIRLLGAICKVLNIEPQDFTKKILRKSYIPWGAVSNIMKNRSLLSCRERAVNARAFRNNLPYLIKKVLEKTIKEETKDDE